MSPAPTTTVLNFGVTLTRCNYGPDSNECGAVSFWQQALDQLYAQMCFPGLFKPLAIWVWHMDHEDQDRMAAAHQYCLEDYDPNTPGYQVADGLTGGRMDLGLFPDGWQAEYTGPLRPITEAARQHARKAMSHEFGHWHQWQCRYGGSDDVAKLITQRFHELRPHQAENEYEDWAECYRALLGADECRGFYSDDKPCTARPEVRALLRTAYWLQSNLANLKITDFNVQSDGVVYRALFGTAWKWRFIDHNWVSQEWDGTKWKFI